MSLFSLYCLTVTVQTSLRVLAHMYSAHAENTPLFIYLKDLMVILDVCSLNSETNTNQDMLTQTHCAQSAKIHGRTLRKIRNTLFYK